MSEDYTHIGFTHSELAMLHSALNSHEAMLLSIANDRNAKQSNVAAANQHLYRLRQLRSKALRHQAPVTDEAGVAGNRVTLVQEDSLRTFERSIFGDNRVFT